MDELIAMSVEKNIFRVCRLFIGGTKKEHWLQVLFWSVPKNLLSEEKNVKMLFLFYLEITISLFLHNLESCISNNSILHPNFFRP